MMQTKGGAAPVQPGTTPTDTVRQPGRTTTNNQTTFDSTSTHHQRHPRTYEAPLRTWTDALAFFLFVAITVAAVFIAGYVLIAVLFVIGQMVTG